jgi:hypothetical protein
MPIFATLTIIVCALTWYQVRGESDLFGGRIMGNLHIALQDGFRNDFVMIKVDGREVYNKHAITTNLVISLADTVDVSTTGPTTLVEVDIPSRKISAKTSVRISDTPYLAVSIQSEDGIEMVPSKEPFRYM